MSMSGILRSEDDLVKYMQGRGFWTNPKYRPSKASGEGPDRYPCIVFAAWYTGYDGRACNYEEYVYPEDFAELDPYSKPIADAARAWHEARERWLNIRTKDLEIKEREALHKLNWMIDAEKNGWDPEYYDPDA